MSDVLIHTYFIYMPVNDELGGPDIHKQAAAINKPYISRQTNVA